MALVEVRDLAVELDGRRGTRAVDGVSFSLARGESLGIVGESGSGKTMTALAIIGLLPEGARVTGSVRFDGAELVGADDKAMARLRGRRIAMVFQEPMTALNPVATIGAQIAEGARLHLGLSRRAAQARAAELMERVGLPPRRFPSGLYPHELSGGQRQRVMIAIALSAGPELLIADEPTTALDVTTQSRILDLIVEVTHAEGMALLMISHDLGVIAEMTDGMVVLQGGRAVETGTTAEVFARQAHPHTRALFAALPERATGSATRTATDANRSTLLLEARDIVRDYPLPRASLFGASRARRALDGVSLAVEAGSTLALIGESGAGKSTLARVLLALERPDRGTVRLDGADLFAIPRERMRALRRRMQMVFQDPYGSLDPRRTVGWVIGEPLIGLLPDLPADGRTTRVAEALVAVGLAAEDGRRYPHEFSGGQRQRIAIARALVTDPDLVVADEPVSALDVSIRAQILDLMEALRLRRGATYLLISHDLTVVRHVADRVAVMYLGRIVEEGPTGEVLAQPAHPYTATLIAAVPKADPASRRRPRAVPPDPPPLPDGSHCAFAPRCPHVRDRCRAEVPPLEGVAPDRRAACFYPLA